MSDTAGRPIRCETVSEREPSIPPVPGPVRCRPWSAESVNAIHRDPPSTFETEIRNAELAGDLAAGRAAENVAGIPALRESSDDRVVLPFFDNGR